MRGVRAISSVGLVGLVVLSACDVYDESLLEKKTSSTSPIPPEQWGSGIGWWSKKNVTTGCVSAGMPTVADRPTNTPDGDVGELYFALRSMALGSLDRNGEPTEGAWRNLGFDLDGLCTNSPTCPADDVALACDPAAAISPDGNECRDNTFGHLEADAISLQGLGKDFGLTNDGFNCALCKGDYNFVFRISKWNGQPNDSSVRLDIYPSPGLETEQGSWKCDLGMPTGAWKTNSCWGPNDKFTIQTGSTEVATTGTGSLPNSKLNDPSAYVKEGYIVAQLPENTLFWFPGKSAAWAYPLKLQRGVVVGKIEQKDGVWRISDGTLAGRARGTDLIEAFEDLGLCKGHQLYALMTGQVGLNADVLWNGANAEDEKCDSLSVGIGFDAEQASYSLTPRDPAKLPGCPPPSDGGTDAAADAGPDSGPSDGGF
jgi:hypothetical protein